MKYDFDEIIDRSSNHSAKYDERMKKFGTEDVIPLWIADMDFRTAQPIIDALTARAQEGIWGYTARPESYFASIAAWQKRRNHWDIDRSLMSFSPGVVQTISAMIQLYTPSCGSVLIQAPVYSEFYDMAEFAGRTVVENYLVKENGKWVIDWADFEAKAARLETDQENRHFAVLEAFDRGFAVDGATGQGDVVQACLLQLDFDQCEHAGEL